MMRNKPMRRTPLLLILAILVGSGVVAVRRAAAQQRLGERFDQLDRNADGKVTPDELPAAEFFKRLDLDGDGAITKPEAARAVRQGALADLVKRGSPGSAGTPAAAEKASPAPAEPPVREGPKPVRPGDHGIGRRIADTTFTDLTGTTRSLATIADGRITVIAMTSTSCPLSRKYLPTLVELAAATADDVAWILVNPVATDTPADMRAAAARFGDRVIYVHDAGGRLAATVGATSTTDVVVLGADQTILYHGAIDDQYGFGYALDAPRKRYLADALAAIRTGDEPSVAATEAPGCVLDTPRDALPATDVTYHGRISRIVARHCVECHREGGAGPFPLETFDDLVAHAPMVREVLDRGTMPPWFAAAPPADAQTGRVHSPWANDRSLAAAEKADLVAWLTGGRPDGDPAEAPARRPYPDGGWQIGTPDAVFEFAEPVAVKATGVMPYQTVIVETHLPEDRWVRAIEVQPGDRNVVHHALIHLAGADEAAGDPRDTAAEERGGFWGEYVPGQNTLVYPTGFAKRLPKGARLKFQMHYTPNGTATTDRTRVGVLYATEPPEHEVRVAGIVNARISIPPGAADHREEASLRLPFDATIMGFLPHLHVRGKACRYELVRGDGSRTTLLDIPRYDFNWQLLYRLHEPLGLHAGDMLVFTAWYDNSAANPANPDPTKTVGWGPQTFDEMHLGYVEYFVPGVAPGEPVPSPGRGGRAGAGRAVDIDAVFGRLDRDGDGRLTGDELPAGQRDALLRLDTDGDGGLTLDEARRLRR
jgi:mono/diheme cytochrome c family protein/thiol-disulfide isomerase/thioredoxin